MFLRAPATLRLLRHLRRDRVERGVSLEKNLSLWGNILDDEERFVRPYAAETDLVVDSFADAELAAMPDLYAELLADEPELRAAPQAPRRRVARGRRRHEAPPTRPLRR